MKKVFLSFLFLICLCITVNVNYGYTGQNTNYNYEVFANYTVQINSYRGITTINNLVIPSTIEGYPVTSIGKGAFAELSSLTGTLTIPNSVTNIGEDAFNGCSGLTGNLVLPTNLTSIGLGAFAYCNSFTGSLTIPSGVTVIPDYAFIGCSGFNGSLTIPNGVTSIGEGAFCFLEGITGSLTIPNSVTSIGEGAFGSCSSLTGTLTLSSNLTKISGYAFAECSGLTGSLTIPSSVTEIGDYAFAYCSKLTGNLTISDAVTNVGEGAFSYCGSLTGTLTISNNLTKINSYTFDHCSGLTGTLTIPNGVTSIGVYAFSRCSNLSGNFVLPNGIASIGEGSFYGCAGLIGDFTINNINIALGKKAFDGCDGLKVKVLYPTDIVDHWSQDILVKWLDRNITSGSKATNLYYPDQYILKADLMYTINRLMKYTDKVENISAVTDVKSTDWYYADVQKAIKAGYIYPLASTKVYPIASVNREQFMVMISRALKLPTANLNVLDKYADKNKVSTNIKQEVANYIGEFGFDGNMVNGQLCLIPQNLLTKADAFYFIDKAFEGYDNPPIVNNIPNDALNHWSKNILESLIDRGITSSHRITKCFYPDEYTLKADLIYSLNRIMKFTDLANTSEMIKYIDVKSTDWFYIDMQKAVKAGYIYPLGTSNLYPNNRVTREELFVMISRAFNLPQADLSVLDKYTDKSKITTSIKQEVANYIAAFEFKGNLVNGNLCLIPQNPLTKSDLMYFIYNALPQEKITVTNSTKELVPTDILNLEVVISQVGLTGDTIPTLNVKIGDGNVVTVTGTKTENNKFTYSYTIPEGSVGYIRYNLTDGNLKGIGNIDVSYSKYYQCDLYKVIQ